jgi:alkanesulfonate monooxygenase SsuD/methylene tetrahydromethanopterin reductase-like flavin-dependent oxidoreductase (luciferase family)
VTDVPPGAPCGVLLPNFDPTDGGQMPSITDSARLAQELGFECLWAGDHLACPAPGLDAPACLAAAAAVTDRIALGFSVMLVGLRAPAWAAKQLATIDALAGPGRLRLGVGVGGEFPEEFAAAGVEVKRRGARLDDTLTVLPELLAGRAVDHVGKAIEVHSPALRPAVASPPPVYVGGRGDPALRRAARFGQAWLPMWMSPAKVAERSAKLGEMALEYDRPIPRTALLILSRIDDDLGRARAVAEAHLRGQYRMGLEGVERWTLLDSIDGAVERLNEYLAVGVSEILLLTLGTDTLIQYERLAEVNARLAQAAAASVSGPAA